MKKLMLLAVLATLVLGLAGTASAVDLEAKGQIQFQANIADNFDFLSAKHNGAREDDLNFWFRARTQFRFIANENLMAELYTEYKVRVGDGKNNQGLGSTDAGNGNADNALAVKRAFLQYRFPGTEVLTTAGVFSINLPGAATGNMALADLDAGAFVVQTPITDQFGIAVGYVRAADVNATDQAAYGVSSNNKKDELDLFYAALPITIDGIEATPYFMYGAVGKDVYGAAPAGLTTAGSTAFNKNADAWWAGTSLSINMFDPITFDADVVYGSVDANQKHNDRSGWMFDAAVAYTGMDFVKPRVAFAYSSGEDDKTDNGSERLPIVNNDWALVGTTYFGGSALTGSVDMDSNGQAGFWTVGLSFEDISFLDKLTHDIHFVYVKGTNDKDLIKNRDVVGGAAQWANIAADGTFLTTKDSVFEVDFNTNYQIYDELAAIVEFGYVNVDLDKSTWEAYDANRVGKDDPALKFAVGLVYKF